MLAVATITATGLISALTVAAVAVQGGAAYNASLTSTLAILIGFFFLLFGAMRVSGPTTN
jgi:sulfate permease, SulP family